jgi:hypothetical protein
MPSQPPPEALDNWVAEEGMSSLTSAQRDALIFVEVRKINGRLSKVYEDWFGDPAAGDGGYKRVVVDNQLFIANLRSGTRAFKWLVGAIGVGNLAAWVFLVARTSGS